MSLHGVLCFIPSNLICNMIFIHATNMGAHIYCSSSYIVFVVTNLRLCCQSKKEGKDQESIQSSTTPDQ